MKNLLKIFVLSLLVFAVGCENEDDPRFQDNPETGWVRFASASTTLQVAEGAANPISIPVDFTAPINLSNLDVTYSITPVLGDPSAILNIGNSLTIAANTNRGQLEMTPTADAVLQLFIAGGNVVFDVTLTSASRGISVGLADGSETITHRVTLECGGEPSQPVPGTYTINMRDSWGDGWQTTASGGGDGITITLTDGGGAQTVLEVGMCSSFGAQTGFLGSAGCTAGGATATAMIDIPAGTTAAAWNFPGDWFGEISFDVEFGGNTVFDSGGTGALAAGPFELTYCPN